MTSRSEVYRVVPRNAPIEHFSCRSRVYGQKPRNETGGGLFTSVSTQASHWTFKPQFFFLSVQALETWKHSRFSGLALLTPDLVQILFTRIPQFLEHSIFLPSITPSLSFLPSIPVPPTRLSGSMPIFLDGNQVSSQMVNRWFLEKQKSV